MQDAKEEVRSRLNIEDVIGEYVRLKRAGRSFKGLSPFTQEKTPSFMVSPDKHVWYDFSSNSGGDIFSFVMAVEGVDFKGALELLARKAGVDLSLYAQGDAGITQKKDRLYQILAVATQYYQQTLLKNERALEYVFKTRGLDKKTVVDFKIGYAPDTDSSLVTFLTKKGYTKADLKDAGLVGQRGGDLFRSRMMIPLMDGSGRVIGYTGRLIGDKKNAPKYLNTPQTLLYDKSRHVFGLHLAKQAIRTEDKSVLVEGNLDVISSHQFGVTNVVATAGTALTNQQLKVLKRLSDVVVLAFDNDRAGLAATERTIPIAEQVGVTLKVVNLPPESKDPDELVRSDKALWLQAIEQALPVVEWVIAEYERRYDLATAEGKKVFSSAVVAIIDTLKDSVEQEHYLKVVADKTAVGVEAVRQKMAQSVGDEPPLRKVKEHTVEPVGDGTHIETLLSLAVYDRQVRPLLVEVLEDIQDPLQKQLATYLVSHQEVDLTDSLPESLQAMETYVKIALLRTEERYAQWSSLDRYDETAKLVQLIKNNMKQQTKSSLLEQLKDAEIKGDDDRINELRTALNKLIKETGK